MHPRKVALGALLLCISSLILLDIGAVATPTILVAAAAVWMGVAVASLVFDRHRLDQPA